MRAISAALLTCLLAASPALAQDQENVPPGNSGVDQYFEVVPDAGGGKRPSEKRPLPQSITAGLVAAGDDGEALLALTQATASDEGIKASKKRVRRGAGDEDEEREQGSGGLAVPGGTGFGTDDSVASALSADTAGGVGAGLWIGLLALTVGMVGGALTRRRRTHGPPAEDEA